MRGLMRGARRMVDSDDAARNVSIYVTGRMVDSDDAARDVSIYVNGENGGQ
jgi:hypothetical protein